MTSSPRVRTDARSAVGAISKFRSAARLSAPIGAWKNGAFVPIQDTYAKKYWSATGVFVRAAEWTVLPPGLVSNGCADQHVSRHFRSGAFVQARGRACGMQITLCRS